MKCECERSEDGCTVTFRVKSPSAVASAALIALLACAAAAYSSDKAASGAWLPAAAVSLVALGLAGASLWSVTEERLSLFREHGVQLESRRFGGRTERRFIDLDAIEAAVINEAVTASSVFYYFAIAVAGADELAVAFPRLKPRLPFLAQVYREVNGAAFGEGVEPPVWPRAERKGTNGLQKATQADSGAGGGGVEPTASGRAAARGIGLRAARPAASPPPISRAGSAAGTRRGAAHPAAAPEQPRLSPGRGGRATRGRAEAAEVPLRSPSPPSRPKKQAVARLAAAASPKRTGSATTPLRRR